MSLRLRLTLWYTAVLAAALLLVSVIVYFTMSFTLNQQTNQFLAARAQQYAVALRPAGPAGPAPGGAQRGAFVRELIATAIANANPDTYAQFVTPDASPVSHTSNLPSGWPLDKNSVDKALSTGKPVPQRIRLGDLVLRIDNFPLRIPSGPRRSLEMGHVNQKHTVPSKGVVSDPPDGRLMVAKLPDELANIIIWKQSPRLGMKLFIRVTFRVPSKAA